MPPLLNDSLQARDGEQGQPGPRAISEESRHGPRDTRAEGWNDSGEGVVAGVWRSTWFGTAIESLEDRLVLGEAQGQARVRILRHQGDSPAQGFDRCLGVPGLVLR